MKIIISNCIEIQSPTKEIKDFCIKNLTYNNPDYEKKKRMGFWAYGISRDIKLYNEYNNSLYLPIGFFNELYKYHSVASDYVDYSVVKKANIKSNIQLRDYQELATPSIAKYISGIFLLPCGLGKTELALECVNRLQQKTLFITHTTDLVKQAHERCLGKMSCKTSLITDGKCDTSGDIVFSTVQTLIKFIDSGKIKQDEFGMLIVDECFPSGTKINTPNGYKNIEDIKIGDIVYSYNHTKNIIEEKKVNYLFNKQTDNLLKIKLSNGKILNCTPNHPIFVNGKYKRADEIKIGDELYEMHSMWKRNNKREFYNRPMERQNITIQANTKDILFQSMWSYSKQQLYNTKKQNNKATRNGGKQSNEKRECSQDCIKKTERKRTQAQNTRWKWERSDYTPRNVAERIKREWTNLCSRISNTNQNGKRKWIPNLLQSGYCDSRQTISNRKRWLFSHVVGTSRTRQKENKIFRTIRVESIEIQEQTSYRKLTRNNKGTIVYNIGVEDNHNYFVNNILVHNCHRTSTNPESLQMFRTCIEYFAARYRLGLTATLHRADKLEDCITKIIGNVIYEIKKDKEEYVCIYEGKELLRFPVNSFQVPAEITVIETNYDISDKDVFDKNGGTLQYSKLISDIANDKERNNLILKTLKTINGSTIVLSDRVDQLKYLCSQVENGVQIDGSTPKKQREKALEDARNGKYKYLFASYALAKEGLDVKILSNLVMATPVRDFAIVTQSIGRIQRPYEGKTKANVYDFVDPVGMLHGFFADRRRTYKKNNWEMNTVYLGGK